MNIKWDADKYTADFSFVHQYGNSVIDEEGTAYFRLGEKVSDAFKPGVGLKRFPDK